MKLVLSLLIFFTSTICQAQDDAEWDDYFMPGIVYKYYVPKNASAFGIYQGAGAEYVIYARAKGHNSKSSGPARIKIYGNLSILGSDNQEAQDIFFASWGLNLAFEGKTKRKYFIPNFGLESGGLFQRDFSTFQFTPMVGVQLVSTKRLLWSAQGGYQYTTRKFDEYSGYVFSSGLNVLLWNKKNHREYP